MAVDSVETVDKYSRVTLATCCTASSSRPTQDRIATWKMTSSGRTAAMASRLTERNNTSSTNEAEAAARWLSATTEKSWRQRVTMDDLFCSATAVAMSPELKAK